MSPIIRGDGHDDPLAANYSSELEAYPEGEVATNHIVT
jgi:hypothetical protein